MKRYIPWKKLVGHVEVICMREQDEGNYVRYEDVRNLVEYILDDRSLWETRPEIVIKEWE